MRRVSFRGLSRPLGQYLEIFKYCLKPDPEPKPVDLCCGLGFGKTTLAIQLAALTLNLSSDQRILFLEPDWDRVNDIFLPKWEKYIPEELYHHNLGKNRIEWWNGAYLNYRPRVITGALSRRRGKFKGIEFTVVIDDETAEAFDLEQYTNTYARIRGDVTVRVRYYLTISTPIIGAYSRFLKRGGNKIFTGRTRDNFYLLKHDPGYEARQRRNMSTEQARRELDAEIVALEGRIWKTVKYKPYDPKDPEDHTYAWPHGNRNDAWPSFKRGEPWWLFCDLGSATGAYVVVQVMEPDYRGKRHFAGSVWVAVADLCPHQDAEASRAFQQLKDEFGSPVGVVAGADINTRASTDGSTISYFVHSTFGEQTPIYVCNESKVNKRVQYNRLNYLMRTAVGFERRFTIARDFVSLDEDSHRGVREMVDEDAWPPEDKIREHDFLPKNKEITVQHTRDALLMGAVMVMSPPDWLYDHNPPA